MKGQGRKIGLGLCIRRAQAPPPATFSQLAIEASRWQAGEQVLIPIPIIGSLLFFHLPAVTGRQTTAAQKGADALGSQSKAKHVRRMQAHTHPAPTFAQPAGSPAPLRHPPAGCHRAQLQRTSTESEPLCQLGLLRQARHGTSVQDAKALAPPLPAGVRSQCGALYEKSSPQVELALRVQVLALSLLCSAVRLSVLHSTVALSVDQVVAMKVAAPAAGRRRVQASVPQALLRLTGCGSTAAKQRWARLGGCATLSVRSL